MKYWGIKSGKMKRKSLEMKHCRIKSGKIKRNYLEMKYCRIKFCKPRHFVTLVLKSCGIKSREMKPCGKNLWR